MKDINRMLDEHLEKKNFAQRERLRQQHRVKLHKLEKQDLPKDALTIPRKDIRSFIFGMLAVFVSLAIIGIAYATISVGQQISSSVATGTAPFSVASTTKVTNLNADLLDGYDSTNFTSKSCKPMLILEQGGGAATFTQFYSCTNCAGWLEAYRANSVGVSATTTYRIEIDGVNSSDYTNSDPITGGLDSGFFTPARYTTSLRVYYKTTGSGTGYVLIAGCQE